MKKLLLIILCLLAVIAADAADPVFVSKDSLMKNEEVFRLRPATWKYHEGRNEQWAAEDFDDSAWPETTLENFEKMKNNGKYYCFRIHFKTDLAIEQPLYLRYKFFVPGLIFLNGKHMNYYSKGPDFKAYGANYTFENPLPLEKGKNNVLVMFGDFSGYNFAKNNTSLAVESPLIPQVVTQKHVSVNDVALGRFTLMKGGLLSALLLMAIFSWFLVFQGRQGKTEVWIAAFISIMVVDVAVDYRLDYFIMVFKDNSFSLMFWQCINSLWVFMTAPVISNVVKNKTEKVSIVLFLCGNLGTLLISLFAGNPAIQKFVIPFGMVLAFSVVFYIVFLIIKNFSSLTKPQWAVITGLFMTLSCGISTVLAGGYFAADYVTYFIFVFVTFLSFPVSLLVYASLRLKQDFITIREKADHIAVLGAEKEKILKEQNEQLEYQVEVRTAELKASQAQLIQSEKLASLGELTAGIAHEIQNPLNFVNNFSEVSLELMQELSEERKKRQLLEDGKRDEELEDELLSDISDNLRKISHHGNRASSIVKGMLEHSRKSSGQKEPADLNLMAEEYLRLAYHGLRAKDKNFKAELHTDFDEDLPKILIIPQDFGRVLLNLIGNAFYASRYAEKPQVKITSKRNGDQVIISIADNGHGVPDTIIDKIFQPFFTTKPTGEGTGLGLSLAYDIVTKGHDGSLTVESKEGEGAIFTIRLPIKEQTKS